jgi:hypothetical protein
MSKNNKKKSVTATNKKNVNVPRTTGRRRNQQQQPQGPKQSRKLVSRLEESHLVDSHTHAWSKSIKDPWKSQNAKIPLSEEPNSPCKTETFSITGQKEMTVPAGKTAIDIWSCLEGAFNTEASAEDPYMGRYTVDSIARPMPLGYNGTASRSVAMVGQYNTDVDLIDTFALPTYTPTNMFVVEADPYTNIMPFTYAGTHSDVADSARLVSVGIRFTMLNQQSQIDGRMQAVCPFEMPVEGTGFDNYRQDNSYQYGVFGSNRNLEVKWWPQCETPMFRQILSLSPMEGKTMRHRIKLSNLTAGDQVLVTFKANYEVIRPRAASIATPSFLTPQGAQLGNAVMTFAGQNGTLNSHMIAHKIVAHPHFSKVRKLADTALEVIGGSAVGSKMLGYLKTALAEVPALVEAAAPLL